MKEWGENQRTKDHELTATEVTKDVIALFREGDLVDSVADVASFQQVAGVFACLPSVSETLDVMIQPIHHI